MGGIKVVNPMAAAMSELEVDSDSDNDEDVTTVSSNTTATVSNADTNIQQDSDKVRRSSCLISSQMLSLTSIHVRWCRTLHGVPQ